MNFNPYAQNALSASLNDAAKVNEGFSWSKVSGLVLSILSLAFDPRYKREIFSVILSTDTSAYTAGDVLADTQEVLNVFRDSGGTARLNSVVVVDGDDQAAADMRLFFFSANVSLGTENSAPSITDANALKLLGSVLIPSANFIDVTGAKVATLTGINLDLKADTGTSLWIAATTAGTPTQTAAGVKLKLSIEH